MCKNKYFIEKFECFKGILKREGWSVGGFIVLVVWEKVFCVKICDKCEWWDFVFFFCMVISFGMREF